MRPASYGRPLVAATVVMVIAVVQVFLYGALIVFIRDEIAISPSQHGAAISLFFLAQAITAVPGGRFADRVGPKRSMTIAVVWSATSLVGLGTLARSFPAILGFLLSGGLASGLGVVSSNLAISRMVPLGRQGVAFGLKQAAIPAASIAAGIAVPALGLTIGWRSAFLMSAGVLVAVFFAMNSGTAGRPPPGPAKAGGGARLGPLLLLAATAGLASAAATATVGFYTASAVDRGFGEATAGYLLAVGSASGIAARVAWGVVADRRAGGHLGFLAGLFLVGSVGFGMLGLVNEVWLLAVATVLVFAAGWAWSGLLFLVAAQRSPDAPATATGVANAGGSIGGLVGPLVFGWLLGRVPYSTAWLIVASWTVGAAVLAQIAGLVDRSPR